MKCSHVLKSRSAPLTDEISNSPPKLGKALKYSSGTGAGAILLELLKLVPPDNPYKEIYILCVPATAMLVADVSAFFLANCRKTIEEFKIGRENKKNRKKIELKIKNIDEYLQKEDVSSALKEDLLEKKNKAILASVDI